MNERIVFTNPDGSVGVLIPTGEIPVSEVMVKDVPAGATNVRQITTAELPQDRLFRNAWDDSNPENFIGTNLTKAKEIAHEMRRTKRTEQFAPLDIKATIPAEATAAEAARQVIRDADAQTQTNIDAAADETVLRSVISTAGLI